jgi:16S rRNA (cytosine1402-N4)-methyltransferase
MSKSEEILHRTVLRNETVGMLDLTAGRFFVDATCGLGGHTEALLEQSHAASRVLAVDRDPMALEKASERLQRFGKRVSFAQAHFSELPRLVREFDFPLLDGVIADLGISSLQLDDPMRGFSFRTNGPLDMRMGPIVEQTVQDLLRNTEVGDLAHILRTLGEVRNPGRLARALHEALNEGRLASTDDLRRIVEQHVFARRPGLHPATQVFQALRIVVNRELEELDALLAVLPSMLRGGGRAAVISFHSLEDRRVKRAFSPRADYRRQVLPEIASEDRVAWRVLTRKPICPTPAEQSANPRSRSAKLRVAELSRPDQEQVAS